MKAKHWGYAAAVILAGVLLTSDVYAQRGGPPGGRPAGGGGRPPGGPPPGAMGRPPGGPPPGAVYGRPGGAYGNLYSPYRGYNSIGGISIGIGVGGYGAGYYPYYASPSYYPYSVAPSYYSTPYVAPRFAYDPPIVVMQAPIAPAAPAIPSGSGQIRVLLPDPNAKVWFDGTITQQNGTERFFHTPKLESGSTYTYRIRAAWMDGEMESIQERVVNVVVGETSVADFR